MSLENKEKGEKMQFKFFFWTSQACTLCHVRQLRMASFDTISEVKYVASKRVPQKVNCQKKIESKSFLDFFEVGRVAMGFQFLLEKW